MGNYLELGEAIDAAQRTVVRAMAKEMRASDGTSATPRLERLQRDLMAMRARGSVGPDELRAMIRDVATWAPQDDVSLLAALGAIASVGRGKREAESG
jgi:hypothetical protein